MGSLFSRCNHTWTKQSDIVLKSGLESLLENGVNRIEGINDDSVLRKCHIVILTCDVCGDIHKEVTYNL